MARHAAIGYLDTCQFALLRAYEKSVESSAPIQMELDAIADNLLRVRAAMAEAAHTEQVSERPNAEADIREAWEEALALVQVRMLAYELTSRFDGPDDGVADLCPGSLSFVLLCLLQNSLEAFDGAHAAIREVALRTVCDPATNRALEIHYEDTAGGIDPGRLRERGARTNLAQPLAPAAVFEDGVTSRRGDRGSGLWLVRRVIASHDASINLVPTASGVHFVICWAGVQDETRAADG